MKKAASKSPAANLGSKRQCPKCTTKFYDFGKEEIVCPKCGAEVDPNASIQIPRTAADAKRPTKVADVDNDDDTTARPDAAASDEFESVDDLADDEDDLVDDAAVDSEEDESY